MLAEVQEFNRVSFFTTPSRDKPNAVLKYIKNPALKYIGKDCRKLIIGNKKTIIRALIE